MNRNLPKNEKLRLIIETAIINGWQPNVASWNSETAFRKKTWIENIAKKNQYFRSDQMILLLDHDFAKALFGEKWKEHLKNAVVHSNLLEYVYVSIDIKEIDHGE